MEWYELYGSDRQPSFEDAGKFIGSIYWKELNTWLQETYHVTPKINYSRCSMQSGWNIKYQKSGKSLCVLYPMRGFFTALVVIGDKEMTAAELMMDSCCEYTRNLFANTRYSCGGRWLMMNVTDQSILEDVKNLISLRVPTGAKSKDTASIMKES